MSSYRRTFLRPVFVCVLIAAFCVPVVSAQTFAYVVNRFDQTVVAIDLSTNTVTASIPTGLNNVGAGGGIAISPDGNHVYETTFQNLPGNPTSNVLVIDTATNTVAATISVPGALRPAVSPDSSRVYVASNLNTGGSVVVIDAATNSVVGSLAIPASAHPYWVLPTATQIYVSDLVSGDIYVVDPATNTLITTIPEVPPTGTYNQFGAFCMALSPDGSRLYANHGGSRGMFSAIDTATNVRLTTVENIGTMPVFAITTDGSTLYAIGIPDDGPFYAIDTTTFVRTTVGDFSQAWFGVAVAPDTGLVYFSNFDHGEVDAFDPSTNLRVASIPLPTTQRNATPNGIVIGRVPPAVPMAAFNVAKLQINTQGFSEDGSFTLGSAPASGRSAAAAAFDPAAQRVVLSVGSFTLTIPPGSFRKDGPNLHWKFEGTVGGVRINAGIDQRNKSTTEFDYSAHVKGPDLTSQARPIRVGLRIGTNVGSALVP
jgi:YVTN family beta-propeller protein